jgi:protein TIF31
MSATTETPYDHKVSKEEELLPSSTSVNADILNLELLSSLRPKGLRLLQTMLINYRGWRLLVQTIIPGLLTS